MENTQERIVYVVNSDLDDGLLYAEYDTEDEAIEYAMQHLDKLPFVEKIEAVVDEQGRIEDLINFTTVWDHTKAEGEAVETEEDAWDMLIAAHEEEEANKHDLGDTTWFESLSGLVEDLEENEDEVECKECFDLYPKAECIKLAFGYICPICAEGGSVDEETFKQEFPEYEKFSDANEMIPEEPAIPADIEKENENDLISTPEEAIPFLVKDEEEAVAGYEKAAEVVEASELENKEEILDTLEHIKEEEEEHIEELEALVEEEPTETENAPISDEAEEVEEPVVDVEEPVVLIEEADETKYWMCFYDGNDVGVVEAATEEEAYREFEDSYSDELFFDSWDHDFGVEEISKEEYDSYLTEELIEHVNEEHPAIESEQELQGIDNAVVDCKVAKVVTHSEDEKPVDCEGKKKVLEKPLTEETVIAKNSRGDYLVKDLGTARYTVFDQNNIWLGGFDGNDDATAVRRFNDGDITESKKPLAEAKIDHFHEAIFEAIDYLTEFEYIFPVPSNIMADTWAEMKEDINYGISSDFEIAEIILAYLDKDLSYSRKHPEIFDEDPQSELTLETYNRLKKAYDRAVAEYEAKYSEDFTESTHAKYAKPEGDRVAAFNNALTYAKKDGVPYIYGYTGLGNKFFALEQPIKVAGDISEAEKEFRGRYKNCQVIHVAYPNKSFVVESYDFTAEEMEEYGIDEDGNSLEGYDTWVRCNWCKEPYPDSECAFEVNLGWLCDRCQEEIRYHGGPLTIKDYPTEEDIAATLENK